MMGALTASTAAPWHAAAARLFVLFLALYWAAPAWANDGGVASGQADLRLFKKVEQVSSLGGSLYRAKVFAKLVNKGGVTVEAFRLRDPIASQIQPATLINVSSVYADGANISGNLSFDGQQNVDLFNPGGSLAPGDSASVYFYIEFDAGSAIGPFFNLATASGVAQGSQDPIEVCSRQDFARADTKGCSPAPIVLPRPAGVLLGLAKSAEVSAPNTDNLVTTTLRFVLTNYGSAKAQRVQVVDDLDGVFGDIPFSILALESDDLTINSGFDGLGDQLLLTGNDFLLPGQSTSILLQVQFEPIGTPGEVVTLLNLAAATSDDEGFDISVVGNDPDPNGDLNPNEQEPTPIVYTVPDIQPDFVLGLANAASDPISLDDGSFDVTLTLTVSNLGDGELTDLQLLTDLLDTFNEGTFEVTSVSSEQFSVNPGFNGTDDQQLLTGVDSLPPGDTGTVTLRVMFDPIQDSGTFFSSVIGRTAQSEDVSTNGVETDPNGDGMPDEAAPTPISFERVVAAEAVLGIAKQASSAVLQDTGLLRSEFTLTLRNYGDGAAIGINVTDDLAATFGEIPFSVVPDSLMSDVLTINPSFNGRSETRLLAGTDSLPGGEFATVWFEVDFAPLEDGAGITNIATVTATNTPADDSTPGDDPDPNGDGVPDESGPTSVPFTAPRVILGLSKAAGDVVERDDGQLQVELTFGIENLGDAPLADVQVADDLNETFTDTPFEVLSLASDALAVNTAFDGDGDINLLESGVQLASGAQATVAMVVVFNPTATEGTFLNRAQATAFAPSGSTVQDDSTNGLAADPDGNGIPDESDGTPISFQRAPQQEAILGLAKSATQAVVVAAGELETQFTFTVENFGTAPANAVMISDDLSVTFAASESFSVVSGSLQSDVLTPNSAFDGVEDTALLVGSDVLAAGEVASVSVTVRYSPGANTETLVNVAQVTGEGLDPDDSTPGDDPDPNGDGDPSEAGETTVTAAPARLGIAKSATEAENLGDGLFGTQFTFFIENFGGQTAVGLNITDDLLQTFDDAVSFEVVAGSLQSTELSVNPAFDGDSELSLLTGQDTLAPGAAAQVTFGVQFQIADEALTIENTAIVTGDGIDPDASTPGMDPDPNGDGDPSEEGTTEVVADPQGNTAPLLGLAKAATQAIRVADGSLQTEFTFTLENFGDAPGTEINIRDDLAATFASADSFEVVAGSLSSPTLTVNPLFNGIDDTLLLAGTDALASGAVAQVFVTVNYTLTDETTEIINVAQALGEGLDPDESTSGDDPDPNGDGDPSEQDGTPVVVDPQGQGDAVLGIAKSATSTINDDGRVVVAFTFTIENFGDAPALAVNVLDDLAATFAGVDNFELVEGSLASATLTVNPAFNGDSDTRLLTGADALAASEVAQISFAVTFEPGDQDADILNVAQVVGDGLTPDDSTPGADPDPNGDGDPSEQGPTIVPVDPVEVGANLGAANAAVAIEQIDDGVIRVSLLVTLENLGAESLDNVQALTDLAATFGDIPFAVESVTSTDFSVNPSFNGLDDQALLAGAGALAVGGSGVIELVLNFEPIVGEGVLFSTVQATADGVEDLSTNGLVSDPNDDGLPSEQEPTPIPYQLVGADEASLGIAKSAGEVQLLDDGSFQVPFTFTVENFGAVEVMGINILDDLAATFAGVETFSVVAGSLVSDAFTVNSSFDGVGITQLLSGTDSLAPGASATANLLVRFVPTDDMQAVSNSAVVTGDGIVPDDSTPGTDPDPNGDGVPDESGETIVPVDPQAGLRATVGLAKSATTVVSSDDNSGFVTTLTFTLENLGERLLTDLVLTDDLTQTFTGDASFEVVAGSLASAALTVNPGFDGSTQTNLLGGENTLDVGQRATVTVQVRFVPNGETGLFFNSATVSTAEGADDVSTAGTNVDPNADTQPNEMEPTPIVVPGRVSGTVFRDEDNDGGFSEADTPLPTWIVEIIDENGELVTTVVVDEQGSYDISDLPPGNYLVQVRHPETNMVWSQVPLEVQPGEQTGLDLPIVPQGLIYDARTRDLVPGVTLSLTDAAGEPLPAVCLLPGQQNQSVGSDGAYRFTVQHGADSSCPTTSATYRISIEDTPSGFENGFSSVLVPQSDAFNLDTCTPPCLIQAQNQVPQIGADTRYFQDFVASAATQVMVNNHLPIDRPFDGGPGDESAMISISVQPSRSTITASGVVGYTITVTNNAGVSATGVEVVDRTAPGLQALPETAVIVRGGADGILGTPDDVREPIGAQGAGPVVFAPFELAPGEQAQIVFVARVSAGARPGPLNNTSTASEAFPSGMESALDTATVTLIADPLFDRATLLGKVFIDSNGNGSQDQGESGEILEPGLAGARIITPEGIIIQTDQHGRYHLADIEVTPASGVNYVVKIDRHSLPDGAQVLSDLRQVVRLSPGGIGKINYAVRLPAGQADCCESAGAPLDPYKPRKELDITVLDVDELVASNSSDYWQVGFELSSNYVAVAPHFVVLIESTNILGQSKFVDARCHTSSSPRTTVQVDVPKGQSYQYSLRAYEENVCRGKASISETGLTLADQGFDATAVQILDLTDVDTPMVIAPGQPGRSNIAVDQINTPVIVPGTNLYGSNSSGTNGFGSTVDQPTKKRNTSSYGVGVIDLTVGGSSAGGGFDDLIDLNGVDDSTYVEGRVAGYWRGSKPTQEHDLNWVLQVDSTKDELSNLGDNLKREDPRRLFRQLDSDLYYPTYGDDSTTLLDTNSQGAFYGRVEYGASHAQWGNYNTGLTDTEFSQYNRTLYGLSGAYAAGDLVRPDAHRYELKVFGSQAQSVLAKAEFEATGGSLYYLRHTDIVMGSEKLSIEVRRRDSEQVEERQDLIAGRDYEIDPIQGRILLQRPLAQFMRDRQNSVIRSASLDGDQVFLVADYEYVPSGFEGEDYLYGARVQTWIGQHLALGATHITEEQGAGEYTLSGVDAVLHLGPNSYVSGEFASSDDTHLGLATNSFDGGLTFDEDGFADLVSRQGGDALGFEAYIDLADVDLGPGLVRAWWKEREAGYSSSRFQLGPEVTDQGIDFERVLSEHWRISGAIIQLEREDVQRTQTARLQVSGKRCDLFGDDRCSFLDLEARREDTRSLVIGDSPYRPYVGEANLFGLRLGHEVTEKTTVYAAMQAATDAEDDYEDNDRVSVGANTKVNDRVALSLEASHGDRGDALIGGVDFTLDNRSSFNLSGGVGSGATTQFATKYQLTEGHELYGSYRVDPDRTDTARNMLTFGQRRDIGNRTRVFTESQFGKDLRQASTGHVLGLEYDATQDWVLSSTLSHSIVERSSGDFERTAVSIGSSYQNEDTRFSARVELRDDDGDATDLRQYVLSSALTHKVSESSRWVGKLNLAWLDDDNDSRDLGRFVEFDLGYAYRPVAHDRFNLISRYAYLYDVGTVGQLDSVGDERSHLLGTEGLYELNRRLQLGGKLAWRRGEARVEKGLGPWFDVSNALVTVRGLYRFNLPDGEEESGRWDFGQLELLAEYRWLNDFEGDTLQQGALLGIYKQIDGRTLNLGDVLSPSIRVGIGYNFSGFDDDMRRTGYRANGWFLDMMALF